ncbi:MAG: hypothetical protein HC800_16960 [Phormidesmis sp. RL_2_1]|nr:hypothetical protein [Phormidesmis sp. RL_2_1]
MTVQPFEHDGHHQTGQSGDSQSDDGQSVQTEPCEAAGHHYLHQALAGHFDRCFECPFDVRRLGQCLPE